MVTFVERTPPMTLRHPPARTARLVCLLAAAGWLFPAAAPAEEPTIILGDGPNPAAAKEVKNILLRPNSGISFFPYVVNTTPNDRIVTAVLLNATGRPIARADGIGAPANGRVPVTFKGDDKPFALAGTQVRLQLLDEKNKEIGKSDLDLRFQVPTEYARAAAAFSGSRETANELKVTVTVFAPVAGGPVKVKLDLSHVPGLDLESVKDGAFEGEISPAGGAAVLIARNLRFSGPPQKGWVAVTVDGYDRAFLFETAFDGSTPQRPPVSDVVTIACKPVAAPTAKFPVRIEVDQPTRADASYLEFGFDKSGTGTFETKLLPGDRDRAVTLRFGGADGALVFGSTVKDWAFDVDATGVLGTRTLRARLLVQKGQTPDPVNDTELRADTRQVVFDNSPPEATVRLPATHVRGTPLRVTVTAVDAESGIDRVLVFVGDPPAADVRKAVRGKVFLADPPSTPGGTFTAELPMADIKGPAVVGTRVVNGAGLVTDASGEVLLVDPKPKPTTGDIKGVVEQGTKPRPQAKRTVWLIDEKQTAILKTAATNDKGEFTFADLAPGNYYVRSDKKEDYATAKKMVTVEAGKTTEVTLELKRTRQ
jgi:hypothetical protein